MKENMIICHRETNEEKNDRFPHWKANGKRFRAERNRPGYEIVEEKEETRCLYSVIPLEMLYKKH